jgi:hypothetical protein
VLQLNVHIYVIDIDLQFEISDFEDPARFFQNRHPRPLELVFSGFIEQTNIIFNKTTLKTREGLRRSKIRLEKKNELQGSGMAISKNATRVLKVTDFEMIVCLRL